jgi:uncharacterized membrane protein
MIDSLYELLARIGFTDPLHPPLTHLPIGLVIGAFIFFLVAIVFAKENLQRTARHVSILAFLFVFPTILFGVFDWLHFYQGALIPPIKYKIILASIVLVLLAAGIILGSEVKVRTAPMMAILALTVVGVVGLGWFGGKLVFGGWAPGSALTTEATRPSGGRTGTLSPLLPGQPIFAGNCSACHPSGGNIVVAELPLKKSKKLENLGTFTSFIRSPTGKMPPFPADQISDKQAGDLHAYITTMLPVWK